MANDGEASFNSKTPSLDDSDSNKSFVKKVKSRVSGFLPSSLTRWFGTTESQVRYRDESDDDDEESFQIQPPTKRIRSNDTLTSDSFQLNSVSTPIHNLDITSSSKLHLNNINYAENKLTFPEPIPGPSGYKPRRNLTSGKSALNKQLYTVQSEVTNGDKYFDSSESVTSGYSSMLIGSKDVVNENKTETVNDSLNDDPKFMYNTSSKLNDRSLFADRCVSPQQMNSSLSTRQPSFNSSVFGSPNFVDRTLASKRILNSPFYSGRTTYGGASAYGRNLASLNNDYKSSLRNSIQIKPVNDTVKNTVTTNTTLSKTARRILDTLEQYTTPILDAKKIPNPTNPNRKKYLSTNPYSVRGKVASNKELQVPTVPDLLKMKLKERLQDSTVTVRQLANSSKSVLNKEEYKIRTLDEADDNVRKHTNKMKNKISSVRQKNEPHRTVEEVKLPDIQLPITTLPKFDFSLPAVEPIKSTILPAAKTIETVKTSTSTFKMREKVTSTQKNAETNKLEVKTVEICKNDNKIETNKSEKKKREYSKITEFTFSDPLVIAENLKSIHAINNFIFSEPTPANKVDDKHSVKDVAKIDSTKSSITATKNNGEKPKKDLVAASLNTLDVYKRDSNNLMAKFKPSEDTWECSVCMIRNVNSKTRCAACETLRSQETGKKQSDKPSGGFGDKFKMAIGQWECKVCLVVNPADKNKCVACESPKQDVKENKNKKSRVGMLGPEMWECETCLVRNKSSDAKCVACTAAKPIANGPIKPELKTTSHSWGNKFAPPPDTWSCDVCAIRNKNDITKCIACQSPRPVHIKASPSGFGDTFKKKENQWECDTCMVKNSNDKERCQCCDALKPGSFNRDTPKDKTPISLFNFGIDPNSTLTTKGFTFGIKPSENKAETPATTSFSPIFGQNTTTVTASVITTSAPSTPTFTFGIKPSHEKSEEVLIPKTPAINVDSQNKTSKIEKPTDTLKVPPAKLTEVVKSVFTTTNKIDEKKEENNTLNGETKPSSVLLGISANTAEPASSSSSNIFAKETNSSAAFAFGANPVVTPVSTSSSSIFGTNSSQTTTAAFKANKSVIFGNPSTQVSAGKPFGAPVQNLFNSNSNQAATFGGSSTTTVETTATIPVFGGDHSVRDEQPPPAKAPMFSFGQTAKPETEQRKFGFGTAQSHPAPGGFNFGQVTAQPNLNFSAGSSAATVTTGGRVSTSLNFEGGSANQNGAAPIFNFGVGANATPKTGYNFGGQTTPSQTANVGGGPVANTTGFNFGLVGNTPAPTAGAFNFSGSTGGEFKPNFNFTAGAPSPTFSAQPTPGDKSARVIRKAVRRAQR